MGAEVELFAGALILFPQGPRVVVGVTPLGYMTQDTEGRRSEVGWQELEPARGIFDGHIDALATSVSAMWAGLSSSAQQQALDRQEVVLTVLTGYARGHASLARDGEPFWPFDPADRQSLRQRIGVMSKRLEQEASLDRSRQRQREGGEGAATTRVGPASPATIGNWCRAYESPVTGGLFALVDGRRKRSFTAFESLDPEIKRVAQEQVARQDGTRSVLSIDELYRRTVLALRVEGLEKVRVPESTLRAYLSHLKSGVGSTTRSQTTNKLRGASAVTSYPALRPGQVVAIDVTRADNFVWDAWSQKAISVEIITALDVATRVVLGVRVTPRSANSMEAALILYDVLRPFSMAISPDRVGDWRWVGVPERLGLLEDAVLEAEMLSGRPLEGEQLIPGVLPDAIRADNGSIFTSAHFRGVCNRFGIHLLLSRGKRPTDNAFVERWHETLQRGLLQVHGHKGRNVSQRGSDVGKIRLVEGRPRFLGDGPLLSARQLERHLREFIAIDYHRSWHQGLTLVDRLAAEDDAALRLTPLEAFDAMLSATGRIHVLQRPDLVYDLLPVRWGTIRHDGVEFKNLTYDSPQLEEFRNLRTGAFRDEDRAAPFFRDPHDVSRVWFRNPKNDSIIEVPWRKSHQLQAPMTDVMLRFATQEVRRRGGNLVLNADSTQRQILAVLNDVGDIERLRGDVDLADWKTSMVVAANMRAQRSAFDHAEAKMHAGRTTVPASGGPAVQDFPPSKGNALTEAEFDPYRDEWPDYLSEEGSSC